MGFYLGAALQMYGRKDDKLYHVLVNEEFENLPEFFYPPAKSKEIIIKTKDGQFLKKSTSEVKIELAELPFLRLKELIDFSGKTFRELIDSTQIKFDNFKKIPYLGFIPAENILKIGDRKIKLSYNLWEFYTKLALQKKKSLQTPSETFLYELHRLFPTNERQYISINFIQSKRGKYKNENLKNKLYNKELSHCLLWKGQYKLFLN